MNDGAGFGAEDPRNKRTRRERKRAGELANQQAELEQKLLERADLLEAMSSAAKTGHASRYDLGMLYYELTRELDFPYRLIEEYVQRVYRVQLPVASTMSRLRKVHEVWVLRFAFPRERLSKTSPHTLYMVQLALGGGLDHDNAREWLEHAETMSREQLMQKIAKDSGAFGTQSRPLYVDSHVAQLFNAALVRFREAVGVEKLSTTAMVEFLAQLVIDSRTESLRNLWQQMHGEDEQ
jgi:hypothetical protein